MERRDFLTKVEDKQSNNDVLGTYPQGMMTVRQMGDLLGLKKTERYFLIHKKYFTTNIIKGQIFVDIESFEEWYKNQLTYRKISGEAPGQEISKNTYSISEVAEILYVTESTVYVILKDTKIPTVEIDHRTRIQKDAFDQWYHDQIYCRDIKETQNPIRTRLLRESADRFISVKEASEIAGISRQAMIKHLDKGHIDYVRFGRDIRISRDSFVEWLNSGGVSSYINRG